MRQVAAASSGASRARASRSGRASVGRSKPETRPGSAQDERGYGAVRLDAIAGGVRTRSGHRRPIDGRAELDRAREDQVVHDLVPLQVDLGIDPMGEGSFLRGEEDSHVVRPRRQEDRPPAEAAGTRPDPHVVAAGEGVVLFLEDEVGAASPRASAATRAPAGSHAGRPGRERPWRPPSLRRAGPGSIPQPRKRGRPAPRTRSGGRWSGRKAGRSWPPPRAAAGEPRARPAPLALPRKARARGPAGPRWTPAPRASASSQPPTCSRSAPPSPCAPPGGPPRRRRTRWDAGGRRA